MACGLHAGRGHDWLMAPTSLIIRHVRSETPQGAPSTAVVARRWFWLRDGMVCDVRRRAETRLFCAFKGRDDAMKYDTVADVEFTI